MYAESLGANCARWTRPRQLLRPRHRRRHSRGAEGLSLSALRHARADGASASAAKRAEVRIGTAKASAKEKKKSIPTPQGKEPHSEKLFKMGKFVRATYTEDSPSLSSDSAAKLLGGCDCPRASPKRQAGPQYGRAEAMLRRRLAAPAAAPSALLLHLRRRQAAGSLPSKSAHLLALCSSAWLRSPLPRAAH